MRLVFLLSIAAALLLLQSCSVGQGLIKPDSDPERLESDGIYYESTEGSRHQRRDMEDGTGSSEHDLRKSPANVPVNIGGSFLTCSLTQAKAGEVGCGLKDRKSDVLVDITKIADGAKWSVSDANGRVRSDLPIRLGVEGDTDWHIYVEFGAEDIAKSLVNVELQKGERVTALVSKRLDRLGDPEFDKLTKFRRPLFINSFSPLLHTFFPQDNWSQMCVEFSHKPYDKGPKSLRTERSIELEPGNFCLGSQAVEVKANLGLKKCVVVFMRDLKTRKLSMTFLGKTGTLYRDDGLVDFDKFEDGYSKSDFTTGEFSPLHCRGENVIDQTAIDAWMNQY